MHGVYFFLNFFCYLSGVDGSTLKSMEDSIVGDTLVKHDSTAFEPRIPKYHKIQRYYICSPSVNDKAKRSGCM